MFYDIHTHRRNDLDFIWHFDLMVCVNPNSDIFLKKSVIRKVNNQLFLYYTKPNQGEIKCHQLVSHYRIYTIAREWKGEHANNAIIL